MPVNNFAVSRALRGLDTVVRTYRSGVRFLSSSAMPIIVAGLVWTQISADSSAQAMTPPKEEPIAQIEKTPPKKLTKQELQYFETRIRPILADKCYGCHSINYGEAEGGLRLDSREAILRGGKSGPAIVPGNPTKSLLIKAIEYKDPMLAMPPKEAGGMLTPEQIKELTRWVRMGAPDPRKEEEHLIAKEEINEEAKSWWSYQPVVKPTVPKLSDSTSNWAWTDIDRFIQAKHVEHSVQPTSDASPETLLRRLTFDLTGLPPTDEEMAAYQKELNEGVPHQKAIEHVVDRLLGSDAYAVHWGRHWLDVARYAESCGREVNLPYNQAWRYRDWVIDAFRTNKPFNEFLIEQIAGDLLPYENEAQHARAIVGTGFLAVGSRNINENNPKLYALDQADEQIDSVFQATMGMTMACARCHDHKFEPISQKQYTAVAGIFLSTDTRFGVWGGRNTRNGSEPISISESSDLPTLPSPWDATEIAKKKKELAKLSKEFDSIVTSIEEKKNNKDGKDKNRQQDLKKLGSQIQELEFQLSSLNGDDALRPLAMGAIDKPLTQETKDTKRERLERFVGVQRRTSFPTIDDSPFFSRGEVGMPGDKIPRGVPDIFGDAGRFKVPSGTSGRLQLARWIASPKNPMTARVAVNRVWHWMMGQGIVDSVDNFGTTGSRPTHPELLDYLASRFVEQGWDVQKLVREIAISRAYQLSSVETNLESREKDPENKILWRAKGRRLQAEEIRDAMLSIAGRLDPKPLLGTALAKKNLNNRVDTTSGKKRGKGEVFPEDICRSIYLPLPRANLPEVLELFDLPDGMLVQGARETTNVPSQSLYLLNNQTVASLCGSVAKRVTDSIPGRGAENFEARVEMLYRLTLCRKPTGDELAIANDLFRNSDSSEAGWISLARGLMATAEFRYLD